MDEDLQAIKADNVVLVDKLDTMDSMFSSQEHLIAELQTEFRLLKKERLQDAKQATTKELKLTQMISDIQSASPTKVDLDNIKSFCEDIPKIKEELHNTQTEHQKTK